METKRCSRCKETKDADQFFWADKAHTRLSGYCKRCHSDWMRAKRYGSTHQAYVDMVALQENKCAICKVEFGTLRKTPQYDHDHATGKVRGILCATCNNGLGSFKDRVDLLLAAIAYLQPSDGAVGS